MCVFIFPTSSQTSHAIRTTKASSRRPSCSNAVPRRTKDLGSATARLRAMQKPGKLQSSRYSSSRGVVCFPKYFQHVIAKIARDAFLIFLPHLPVPKNSPGTSHVPATRPGMRWRRPTISASRLSLAQKNPGISWAINGEAM